MRTCQHMPGAAKDVKCPLCKDLATYGQPVTKDAIRVLNNQEPKEEQRTCPTCGQPVKRLVTRDKVLMCQQCAEVADDTLAE